MESEDVVKKGPATIIENGPVFPEPLFVILIVFSVSCFELPALSIREFSEW